MLLPDMGHECFHHVSIAYRARPRGNECINDGWRVFVDRARALWLHQFGECRPCYSRWARYGRGYGLRLLSSPLRDFLEGCRAMLALSFDFETREWHCSNSWEIIELHED